MVDSVIADNTRRIIMARGLKNRAVAKKAGFSEQQFSAILNKRRVVRDVDVIAIAQALEVTPNELFARIEPDPSQPRTLQSRPCGKRLEGSDGHD